MRPRRLPYRAARCRCPRALLAGRAADGLRCVVVCRPVPAAARGSGRAAPSAGAVIARCRAWGRRLVATRTLRVIEQRTAARGTAYVCVPPNGRVRRAGYAFDNTAGAALSGYSVAVSAFAGTWAAIDYRSTVDFHGGEDVLQVTDARSGRAYRIWSEGARFEYQPTAELRPTRVLLNRFGQAAVALAKAGTTEIVGFEPDGAARVLDSAPAAQIPVGSLTLTDHDVAWIDSSVRRSASL